MNSQVHRCPCQVFLFSMCSSDTSSPGFTPSLKTLKCVEGGTLEPSLALPGDRRVGRSRVIRYQDEDMKRATMISDDFLDLRKSFNCNANPCKVLEVENALKSGCKDRVCTSLSPKMQLKTPFWIHLDTTWTIGPG